MANPYQDCGYAIKAVWGTADLHPELHFSHEAVALKVAHRGERVLMYETAHKADGSMCIFGAGKIAARQFAYKPYAVDDKHFDYAVPFEMEIEFPLGDRHRGIRFGEIPIIGKLDTAPVLYQLGGIDFIDGLAWNRVYEELKRRYAAYRQGGRP